MKHYRVKIGYIIEFNINAKNKKEAEEYAWFNFDETGPHEPEIDIEEFDPEIQGECKECGSIYNLDNGHRCMRI